MALVELRIDAPDLRPEVAKLLVAGDWVKLWSPDDFDRINIYARRTLGDQGLIGTITKSRLPLLARHWRQAEVTIVSIDGCHAVLVARFRVEDWEVPE